MESNEEFQMISKYFIKGTSKFLNKHLYQKRKDELR